MKHATAHEITQREQQAGPPARVERAILHIRSPPDVVHNDGPTLQNSASEYLHPSPVASLPRRRVTIGGDKAYDTSGFVDTLRALEATPHIAQKQKSRTLDGRTTRHPGYAISQRARKRIEEVFGWMKPSAAWQAPSPRRRPGELAVSARGGGLQPGADAYAGGDGVTCDARPSDAREAMPRGRLLNRPRNRHERSNFSILLDGR